MILNLEKKNLLIGLIEQIQNFKDLIKLMF